MGQKLIQIKTLYVQKKEGVPKKYGPPTPKVGCSKKKKKLRSRREGNLQTGTISERPWGGL